MCPSTFSPAAAHTASKARLAAGVEINKDKDKDKFADYIT